MLFTEPSSLTSFKSAAYSALVKLGGGFGALKGLLGATLFFLLANLATDMVYGPQADRPEWMTRSRTYPLLNATGRGIVDWVEARRKAGWRP